MSRARRRARESELTAFMNRLDREVTPEFNLSPRQQPQTPDMAATRAIEALVAQLANMQQPPVQRPKHKTPTFNGDTDVELFITQFRNIADTSAWNEQDTLLQLRSSLEGKAVESGRCETTNEVFQSLRQRFGMTVRQARDKLDSLRKTSKQDLFDFGDDIKKLTEIAYPDQDRTFLTQTALEKFIKGLSNSRLQQHMLLVRPANIPDAIRAAEEFLQYENKPSVQQVHMEEATPPATICSNSVTASENKDTNVQAMTQIAQSLSSMMQTQSQVVQAMQDHSQNMAKFMQAQSQVEKAIQDQSQAIHLLQNQSAPTHTHISQPQQSVRHNDSKAKKTKQRAHTPPAPCWNCQGSHWRDQCPYPNKTAQVPIQQNMPRQIQAPTTGTHVVSHDRPNTRCANCGDTRHWLYQCPHSQTTSAVHQSAPMSGNGPAPSQ